MSLTPPRFEFNWPDCQPIAKARFASSWLVEFQHVPEGLDIHALALHTSATLSALAQEMYRDEGASFVCRFQRVANRVSVDIETVEHIIELQHYIPLVCLFKSLNTLVGPIETIQGQKLEDWLTLTHLFRAPISTEKKLSTDYPKDD